VAKRTKALTVCLEHISRDLSREVSAYSFAPPVTHVYDPLQYAWSLHVQFLALVRKHPKALLLGMNPGPWGMAQTGVPFGEIDHVRNFLKIDGEVKQPAVVHPKRPVRGMASPRSEVSGRRLWSWAQDRFSTRAAFFKTFWVWNWCPLAFMEEGGRNRTPDKLPLSERIPLEQSCDAALVRVVEEVQPSMVIGVGAFARKRAALALAGTDIRIEQMLHPSPASPAANRGWAQQVDLQLGAIGVMPG
jgi:single-strand selective monofunctional uracil DNA glycosylase